MEQKKTKSLVQEHSFRLAVDVVKYAYRQLQGPMLPVLLRQLLRSGTSLGANIEEALGGRSRKDFIAKLTIAAREARETSYRLRLIRERQLHGTEEVTALLNDCTGLTRMLNSSILTTRERPGSHSVSNIRTPKYPDHAEPRTQNPGISGNSELKTPAPLRSWP